jgi:hypothetical protein
VLARTSSKLLDWTLECQKDPEQKSYFFYYLVANSISVALMNETHLYRSTKLKCPNFYTCRSEREDRLGESKAILIKKEIKYSRIFLSKLQHMGSTAAQLHINSELITLVTTCNTPRQNYRQRFRLADSNWR